jgi:lysophospholipase L1-like esterase
MTLFAKGSTRAALRAGALVGALLLGACGGGGTQTNSFRATRVIALGDESSVINNDGGKYTVNALIAGSNSALDCTSNLLWVQLVASTYGLVFPQCASGVPDPASRIYAANGAVVADLSAQIDAYLTNGGAQSGDLVTVLVGANDVVGQFVQYPTVGEDQLASNLEAAGTELANQVNRLADLGVKVLVSTIPDIGLTPYAGDRSTGSTDGNPPLLSRLSTHFNDALLANLTNDGHKIGLIQLDEYLRSVDTSSRAGNGPYAETTKPSCTVPLPRCTTNTQVPEAVGASWLWADPRRISPTGQSALGSLASTRAHNNPF